MVKFKIKEEFTTAGKVEVVLCTQEENSADLKSFWRKKTRGDDFRFSHKIKKCSQNH